MSIYNNRMFNEYSTLNEDRRKRGVFMGKYTKGRKPLLSISLLVSNNIDTIRNCMESIKPLLEAVPSELIVVDGGSKDGAIDIAKEYADEVVPFVWCDDFSAARNAGLEKSSGEWFLYLDDDEWFEDITELIQFFQTGEYKQYEHGWYKQRNYTDKEGSRYTECYVSRMHKRVSGLQFHGKIHESFMPASSVIKQFSCYVHHYGYVFDTSEQQQQKSRRNLVLLEAEYKKNPKDLRMAAQLIQEYIVDKQFEQTEQFIQKLLQEHKNTIHNPFIQYAIICLVRLEEARDDWEKAEEKLHWIEENYCLDKPAQLVCAVEHIIIADKKRDYKCVLEAFPKYSSMYTQVRDGGMDTKRKLVMDLYAYVSEIIEEQMVDAAMRAMLKTDNFSLAEQVFSKVKWEEEKKWTEAYGKVLLRAYEKDSASDAFFQSINAALNNPLMHDMLLVHIEQLLAYDPRRREIFLEKAEVWHRTEDFFRLLFMEHCLKQGQIARIEESIQRYFTFSTGKYDALAAAVLLKEPAWIGKLLEIIDFTTFQQGVSGYLREQEPEYIWNNMKDLEVVWPEQRQLYYNYMRMQFYEEVLLLQKASSEVLWDYVEAVLAFAEGYFGEAAFAENGKGLPRNGQFAVWMQQAALCKNAGDRVGWSERVKQAAELYPVMIPAIQTLLQAEAKPQRTAAVSEEMLGLAAELKKQIRGLIAVERYTEAKEFVLALEQYIPNDAETKELKEILGLSI